MPSRKPWLRLYTAMRTDPRMLALDDGTFRFAINLLCLAGESTSRGTIEMAPGVPYSDRALAIALGCDRRTLAKRLDLLISAGVFGLVRASSGALMLLKWASNNPDDPTATIRQMRHRANLPRYDDNRDTYRDTTVTPTVTVTPESRVEKSTIRVEKSTPLPPPSGDTTQKKAAPVYPDWFEPITRLPGFLNANHARAIDAIIAACDVQDINPGALMVEFAAYWPRGRLPTSQGGHGWTNPVRALIKTLDIQISKHLRGGNSNGHDNDVRPIRGQDHRAPTNAPETASPFAKYR